MRSKNESKKFKHRGVALYCKTHLRRIHLKNYLANWWFCNSRSLSPARSRPLKPLLLLGTPLLLAEWAIAGCCGGTGWWGGGGCAAAWDAAAAAAEWLLSPGLDMDRKCSEEKWGGLTSCWLCILLGVWDLVGGADSIQCSELGVWASGLWKSKKCFRKCKDEVFKRNF